jgi:tetratricopeptide (TPR) repeat protein
MDLIRYRKADHEQKPHQDPLSLMVDKTIDIQKRTIPEGTKSPDDSSQQTKWNKGDMISGNYEVLKVLSGGMAELYVVFDHKAKEILALKTLQNAYFDDKKAQRLLVEGAKKWSGLGRHKNIVPVHKAKKIGTSPVLIMDYVAGRDLSNVMSYGVLSIPVALEFGIQFCRGMEYARRKLGMTHMGLRPANCVITRDRALRITDFGLARTVMGDVPADMKRIKTGKQASAPGGAFLRTLPYMPPEHFTDKQGMDIRADIYTFGVFLYEMLTSTWPVKGDDPFDFMEQHLSGNPRAPRELNGEVSGELESIILKCLEKRRENRFSTFVKLEECLQEEYWKTRGRRYPEAERGKELEAWETASRGYSLAEFGRFEWALDYYDKALALNPASARTWSDKGRALAELGHHREALKCYDRALEREPEDIATLINKGHAMASLGRRQEALKCYDRALSMAPGEADALYNKACIMAELGGTDDARRLYEKTLSIDPAYDKACYNNANLLNTLNRTEEALIYYDRSLASNPGYAIVWMNKGLSLARLGRHHEALSSYERALAINPEDSDALFSAGRSLAELGRTAEALNYFDRALSKNPRNAEAWLHKGHAHAKLDHPREALLCYDQALAAEPRHVQALLRKGIVLFELGQLKKSLHCFDGVISVTKIEPLAWYYKGMILHKKLFLFRGHGKDDAMKCLHNAVELEPGLAEKVEKILST